MTMMQIKTQSIIYPGTFDPITNGHVNLIARAAKIFDKIIVAVAEHTSKQTLLTFQERIKLSEQSLSFLDNITVLGFQKLLVDFAKEQNIFLILRGIRAIADFEYERQLSRMNHHLSSQIETIFMTPDEKYAHISSTFVRDIVRLDGNISDFVPQVVAEKLQGK